MENNYMFSPVLGEESVILNQSQKNGSLYFSTDTRKIYLDADEKSKLPIGGHGNLYYGNMELTSPPVDGQTEFEFNIIDDIVGNNVPESNILTPGINDLILNSDGCFYKVIQVNSDNTLVANKLTIAGSGGGGGGSSDPDSLAGMGVSRLRANNGNTVLYQTPCPISFAVKVTDDLGDPLTGTVGTYDVYINDVKKISGTVNGCTTDTPLKDFGNLDLNSIPDEQLNTVNVGPYLPLESNITVKISVTSISGHKSTRSINISVTNMKLKWDYDERIINYWTQAQQSFELSWSITGNLEKTTHIIINDDYDHEITITGTETEFNKIINFAEHNLYHGAHKIEMYATATLGGYPVPTEHIIKNIIVAKWDSNSTIISFGLFEKDLIQYNTVQIPIIIYDPKNTAGKAEVRLIENGEVKDIWKNIVNQEINYWSYTPTVAGTIVLGIQCNGISESRTINISALDIDINEKKNYAFKFKASDFSSNTNVQQWNSNGINATFSEKFDWRNGGLKSELDENKTARQFLYIKAGSTMTINYNAFGIDPRKGKCLKVIFKATKCKDYDAEVLKCYDGSNGLVMKAQNAIFNYAGKVLTIPYCEDEYIEFELDIAKDEGNKKRYIRPWLDGVPAGVSLYSSADEFETIDNTSIVIGSNDCDICLYMIKLYETSLTDDQHLDNFIADAPNATEMVLRFNRNDIINEDNGEISYIKLAEKNPDCRVHLYEMERMTMNKNDPIENCSYAQYKGSKDAILTAEGVKVKVQGTSSAAYGLAAFNLDSQFKQGFTDNLKSTENKHIDKWSMSSTAIPVDYFCTKVNVASSEGTNNAINQEWYNKFQPYQTVVRGRKKGEYATARDCMEFTPGVIFIKDNNPETNDTKNGGKGDNVFKDTEGYCSTTTEDGKLLTSSYHKMYSIGCMGNSKKNVEVFHDDKNPYECCVENGDNQYPGQWMTDVQGGYSVNKTFYAVSISSMDENDTTLCPDGERRNNRMLWENALDEIYGFRYPDGIEAVKEKPQYAESMIKGWYDFVYWMAHSNPQPAYERVILTEEQFNNRKYDLYRWKDRDHSDYEIVSKEALFDEEHIPIVRDESWTDEQWIEEQENNLLKAYFKKTNHVFGATNKKLDEPKQFSEYKFKGYKAPDIINGEQLNLSQYQSNYTPVLKDLIINDYAGTYTHDTPKYRMAKMLSECEEHLCMDSIVYHYLFIERHSMVDNVAKNTFWSTEDGQVWNLTKNYDNDTSDGNDNQGKLSLTYGFEPGDVDSQGVSIFNAGNSVWMAFIKELYPACQKMYTHLDSLGAWSSTDYLKAHKDWQKSIPERCWIEDYYRKYLRPYEIYDDQMFLPMHEGGQKTHQRNQYETYQDFYISSKYFGSTCRANSFILRGENKDQGYSYNINEVELPVTLYADCYVRGAYGSGTDSPNVSMRCKRNTNYIIKSPISDIGDATIYLWPSNLYQSLGDINTGLNSYGLTQFTSEGAKKLRTLSLGIWDNNNETNNTTLTEISFTNNENLENVYVAEYLAAQDLDLTKSTGLINIDGRDSGFKSVSLPDNSPIESILLNDPVTLVMSNLTNVTTFNVQQRFDGLKTIVFDNLDLSPNINTQTIVDNAQNLEKYQLKNVIWSTDNVDINNHTIPTLEKLLLLKPASVANKPTLSQQDSLTGSLTITNFTGTANQALDIYETYAKSEPGYEKVLYSSEETFKDDPREKWWIDETGEYVLIEEYDPAKIYYVMGLISKYPNLDISFEFTNSNEQLYTIYIYDGDGNVFWQRKSNENTTITEDFLKYGPNGSFTVDQLYKSPTAAHWYEFTGVWKVVDAEGERSITTNEPIGITVKGNAHLYPEFTKHDQEYTVSIKSKHPKTGEISQIQSAIYRYGTGLAEIIPSNIPYVIDDDLTLLQGYDFLGYSLVDGSKTIVSEKFTVTDDTELWTVFEFVEDMRKISHPEWFNITNSGALSPKYKLGGKITIPNKVNNIDVKSINSFGSISPDVTHVFLQNGNILDTLSESCFSFWNDNQKYANSVLQYFDFEQAINLTTIGDYAFQCINSINHNFSNTKIETIGDHGFNQLGGGITNVQDSYTYILPDTIRYIDEHGFTYIAEGVPTKYLQIGTQNKGLYQSGLTFDPDAFMQNTGTNNRFLAMKIYVNNDSVKQKVEEYFTSTKNGSLTIGKCEIVTSTIGG